MQKIQRVRAVVHAIGVPYIDNSSGSHMVNFEALKLVDDRGEITMLPGALAFGDAARAISDGGELEILFATGIPIGVSNSFGGRSMSPVFLARESGSGEWMGEKDIEELKRIRGDVFKSELIGYPLAIICFLTVIMTIPGIQMLWRLFKARRMANAMPSLGAIAAAVRQAKNGAATGPQANQFTTLKELT